MIAIVLALVISARSAGAEECRDVDALEVENPCPWYIGPSARHRVFHLAVTVAAAGLFLASETVAKSALASDHCRWCQQDSFDVDIRNALLWNNPARASTLSTLTGYVATP